MNIAIIAHNLHPIREPFEGGLEMVTYLLCKSLMELGHKVDLFAHKDSDTSFNVYPISLNSENSLNLVRGGDRTYLSMAEFETIGYTNVMSKIALGNYDVVHNHSLHFIPILMGNSLNVPMVTSIHTPQFTFLKIGANEVKNHCSQTFTMVSRSLAKSWENIIPHSEVVYNGIDLSKWGYNPNANGDYLFWYGRICPEKGAREAIEAAVKGKHKLLMAGPISNLDYYHKDVKGLLDSSYVEYVGHLSQKEIIPLLQNAKALMFTSTWEEPYGLTLAESLACGTPVIAYEGGATQEILTQKCGIIVPKNSLYKLVHAIPAAKKLKRSDCRERAEKFCSHKLMVESYLDVYDSLLEQREYKLRRIS